jgi:hypothetical protein
MSEDDGDRLLVKLCNWIEDNLGFDVDDLSEEVYTSLQELVHTTLDPFYTKERNYN